MNKIFDGVAGNHPALNRFDLSYTDMLSAKIGLLYPVQCDECYPGDVFKMSAFCHCEVQPMVAPLMSDLTIYAHSFFVPYRLIYGVDNSDGMSIWEKFITGGKDGDYDTPLTPWEPDFEKETFSSETIWDCVGNPVIRSLNSDEKMVWTPVTAYGLDVSIAPKWAYWLIYNNYYRDENLVDEVDKDTEDLAHVSFKKDYFTSALEEQQRGVSPAIPITGSIPVEVSGNQPFFVTFDSHTVNKDGIGNGGIVWSSSDNSDKGKGFFRKSLYNNSVYNALGSSSNTDQFSSTDEFFPLKIDLSGTTLTGSTVGGTLTGVNINQLRLMFAQQRLLELSMRSGYRYTEFLSAHYGVSPTDARLDRPEYIGGCLIPINVSPAVQSSNQGSGSTPQGNKVGIANANSIQKIGNYRVLEHGIIMTLISIRPKPIYKQGINKQWLRQSRWDYYFPEMAYLSENGIYNAEIYCDGMEHENDVSEQDNQIFGYQAAWNEMRCKNNQVCGAVRDQFDYWTTAREFGSRPHLNEDFITIRDEEFNRVFAVQDEDEFIISWNNLIDAYRPIPAMGVPGLVDHVYGGR